MPDPRKDRGETPGRDPARTEPVRRRPPPDRPGQGYGNAPRIEPGTAPDVEDVEAWHRESGPSRSR